MSGHRLVWALGAAQLLAWASSYYLLATLARPMADHFGLAPVWLYGSFSAALVLAALIGPASGHLIDRFGGRRVLMLSNALFALALIVMATAVHPPQLLMGWLLLGVAMPLGLYDAAFATLVRLRGAQARGGIVGITLIAGFASSVSWPLSAWGEVQFGWRWVCAGWAVLHLTLGLGIHAWAVPSLKRAFGVGQSDPVGSEATHRAPLSALILIAVAFTASGFVFAAMATHLPALLRASGTAPAVAVGAASLVGVAQVLARLAEAGVLRRWHPLVSAHVAAVLHPIGAAALLWLGAPAAVLFAVFHGAGTGLMTIVKGTLPLALFGAQGFGRRGGWLEAPARVAQAVAPIAFGLSLDRYGFAALWLSFGIAVAGVLAIGLAGFIAHSTSRADAANPA